MLDDEVFSQRIDPMLLQETFQTPFSNTTTITTTTTTTTTNNNNKKKKKKKKKKKEKTPGRWHSRNTHFTPTGSIRIFKRVVPVDYSYQSKKK